MGGRAVPELRVAFVRMGDHPIPNRLLPPELSAALDGAALEILDLEPRIRRDPLSLLVNPLFVLLEHGWSLLRGRTRPWRAFFGTTFAFRRMSALARRFVEGGGFDLSFQMQSLFDASAPGVPHFVYTDHTHLANLSYPDFDRRSLRGPRWLALERGLYADAALVFTRSRNISDSLREEYGCPPERVVCVGAGSNTQVPDDPAPSGARGDGGLLFVGVDFERKGGPELLRAFEALREGRPGLRLVIVGCRPAVDTPGVEVRGTLPLEEVRRCYEAADVFCLPTRLEPFGVAIIEAMHFGLPVVATRVGAVPELVRDGEGGYLSEVGDVDGLAAAIERLLADPAAARAMGERNRARARAEFTWPGVAARMAEHVRARLAPGSAPPPEPTPADRELVPMQEPLP